MKKSLPALLFAVFFTALSVSGNAEETETVFSFMPARPSAGTHSQTTITEPETTKNGDVDSVDVKRKFPMEAVLLRANAPSLRTFSGPRTPVVIRALLCEASFFPFRVHHNVTLHKVRPQSGITPISIIQLPRPPPFVLP